MLTYNQILRRIKNHAISHLQIDSFYAGNPHEFEAQEDNQVSENVSYAACFCETLGGSIDRTRKFRVYNFRLYFLDRVMSGNMNEQEVQSDMDLVAQDIVSMMGSDYYTDMEIDPVSSCTFVTEQLNDLVAGVQLDLTVNAYWVPDICQVPRDAITTETGFDIVTEQQQTLITE